MRLEDRNGQVARVNANQFGAWVQALILLEVQDTNTRIRHIERIVMGLAELLPTLTSEEGEIEADVAALQDGSRQIVSQLTANAAQFVVLQQQIADLTAQVAEGGAPSTEQLAELQGSVERLATDHTNLQGVAAAISAAISGADAPPAPAPAPVPEPAVFVAKLDGEDYAGYVARIDAWNADPANVDRQLVAGDEAAWDALPVG